MEGDVFECPGVDELFALEPSEFTNARNALAAQLRKKGDREVAQAIKKLPRPSAVAWALNKVARERPAEIEEVLALGDRVREAQTRALEGGDPGALREATSARRNLIRDLASAVAAVAGESHRSQATETLEAASMDESASELLRAGRLSTALEPRSGFGLEGMPEPRADAPSAQTDPRERLRLERELEATEAALAHAEARVTAAEDRLAEAEQTLERARAESKQAQAERQAAVSAVEGARGVLR